MQSRSVVAAITFDNGKNFFFGSPDTGAPQEKQ
jgi:hypothetical protein